MDSSLQQEEFDSFITNLANPKFRRLFELYLKTLYDPQERKKFEADLKVLQLSSQPRLVSPTENFEQGDINNQKVLPLRVEVPPTHITPEPGFVLRVQSSVYQNYTSTKRLIYLNICHHTILSPVTLYHSHACSQDSYYQIPYIVHLTYNGPEYKIYDVVFSTKTLNESRHNETKRKLLIVAALQIVQEQYAEKLEQYYEILPDIVMKNPPHSTDLTLLARTQSTLRADAERIASQKQNAELQQILTQIPQVTMLCLTSATTSLFTLEEQQQIISKLRDLWPKIWRHTPEIAHIPFTTVNYPMICLSNDSVIPPLSIAQTLSIFSVVIHTDQRTEDWCLQFCVDLPDSPVSKTLEVKGKTDKGKVFFVLVLQLADHIETASSFATLSEHNLVIVLKKKELKFWLNFFDTK